MGLSRRKYTAEFKAEVVRRLELGASAAEVARAWCAEHVRQLGGESPLPNLMEVKG